MVGPEGVGWEGRMGEMYPFIPFPGLSLPPCPHQPWDPAALAPFLYIFPSPGFPGPVPVSCSRVLLSCYSPTKPGHSLRSSPHLALSLLTSTTTSSPPCFPRLLSSLFLPRPVFHLPSLSISPPYFTLIPPLPHLSLPPINPPTVSLPLFSSL